MFTLVLRFPPPPSLPAGFHLKWVSTSLQYSQRVVLGCPSLRQTCKACGRPDKFDFHVPDHVWVAVVPTGLQKKVVCLFCFDAFAMERQIDYAAHLQTIYFAGDRAAFEFRTVWCVPVATDSCPQPASPCIRCRVPRLKAVWTARRSYSSASSSNCYRSATYRTRPFSFGRCLPWFFLLLHRVECLFFLRREFPSMRPGHWMNPSTGHHKIWGQLE